jgi:hypothetical protein
MHVLAYVQFKFVIHVSNFYELDKIYEALKQNFKSANGYFKKLFNNSMRVIQKGMEYF